MSGAASGVAVDDACVQTYMDVKRKRAHKFVLYHIGAFAPRPCERTHAARHDAAKLPGCAALRAGGR